MKSNKYLLLFNIGIFILILETSQAWMFWNVSNVFRAVMYVTILGLGLLNYQEKSRKLNRNEYFVLAALFLFIANAMKTDSSLLGMAQMLVFIMIMWFVMVMPINQKKKILDFQTKALSIFLMISLIAWGVHFFYNLPCSTIYRQGYEHVPPAQNYYLFITTHYGLLDYRFHSIFLEPGHLGCILSFFLMANQYDFGNRNVQLMSIVLFFTLSLAGFVIFYLGFLFYIINKRDWRSFKWVVFVGLLSIGIWQFGKYYNGGDNYVNVRIVERLQYDEETGLVAGDNRYSDFVNRTFNQTIKGSDVLFGLSSSEYRHFISNLDNGAGIKLWIIQKGIIGGLMLFLGYYFIARSSKNKRWAMFMLLVYIISSYQRVYFLWASYLIPFICGSALPFFTQKKKISKKLNMKVYEV